MAAPTVRNFSSFPPGNGDAFFGPGALPLTVPGIAPFWTSQNHDTIVVFVGVGGATVTGVTDTESNTYTNAGSGWWVAKNITGGALFTVTVTLATQVQYPVIYVWDVANASLTAPFEQAVTSSGGSPATPTVALTTIGSDDLILVCVTLSATSSAGVFVTNDAGWTMDTSYTQVGVVYEFVPSANNGVTPYGGAEHLGVTGIFSGNITMPITSGAGSYSAWYLFAAAIQVGAPAQGRSQAFLM